MPSSHSAASILPRRLRVRHRKSYNEPGHVHELTFSCYHGYPFLTAERVCGWLADSIVAARVRLRFSLWAYVFMPEHVHLIIYPQDVPYVISDILQAIKEPVGREAVAWLKHNAPEWLSRISRQAGGRVRRHFWQRGGGYDRNVVEPRTLSLMIDDAHQNPERRRLVPRACDWKWSSAAYLQDLGSSPLPLDPIPPEWLDC